jgi:hypothetical protein
MEFMDLSKLNFKLMIRIRAKPAQRNRTNQWLASITGKSSVSIPVPKCTIFLVR